MPGTLGAQRGSAFKMHSGGTERRTCTHTRTHPCTRTRVHMHVHTHMHAHTDAHTRVHTDAYHYTDICFSYIINMSNFQWCTNVFLDDAKCAGKDIKPVRKGSEGVTGERRCPGTVPWR